MFLFLFCQIHYFSSIVQGIEDNDKNNQYYVLLEKFSLKHFLRLFHNLWYGISLKYNWKCVIISKYISNFFKYNFITKLIFSI